MVDRSIFLCFLDSFASANDCEVDDKEDDDDDDANDDDDDDDDDDSADVDDNFDNEELISQLKLFISLLS